MSPKLSYVPSIIKNFKCPLCDIYLFPPISQCVNGHTFCKKCFELVGGCDTCRAPVSEERHKLMEMWSENLLFPCECEINGCQFKGYYKDVLKHQKTCQWTYCNWKKTKPKSWGKKGRGKRNGIRKSGPKHPRQAG
ncbi:unnamed protein product [Brassicogethes aeneus]|uniref:E3 ubiquitin-protein ligase Sina-like RING finger domain-containing protein n=1 Tax=Brassicogethes aeneus TaxID=1431903 RepID=A0A9P0FLX2_BRAAE|nr:unnamed protein product [Brassicogethes aeneus]